MNQQPSARRRQLPPQSPAGDRIWRGMVLVGVLALALPARADFKDNLIRNFCLEAVQAELAASAKPTPKGMAEFTCNCVVSEINQGSGLDGAKRVCRDQARRHYGV